MKNVASPPAEIVFEHYIKWFHTLPEDLKTIFQRKWLIKIHYDWNLSRGGIKSYLLTLNPIQLKHCLNSLYEIFH